MKTVFITGASTGIGYECAKIFMENGWNVAATMRNPQNASDALKQGNVLITKMDVTDGDSIKNAVKEAICRFGQIDVLINNAGYYSIGVVEAIPEEEIRRQIETNLLGLIYTTKAILPYMRKKRSGLIVNLSSVAGRTTVPLQSIYHAAKWGVEGFSQSLQYSLSSWESCFPHLRQKGPSVKCSFSAQEGHIISSDGSTVQSHMVQRFG